MPSLRGVDQVEKGATKNLERRLAREDQTEFSSRVGFAERDRRVGGNSGAVTIVRPRAKKHNPKVYIHVPFIGLWS